MKFKPLLFSLSLALAALACNTFVPLPGAALTVGEAQIFSVDAAAPAGAAVTQAELYMAPSAASLTLAGGAEGLAQGEIEYNVEEWLPVLTTAGGVLRIAQSTPEDRITRVNGAAVNRWQVALGAEVADIAIACPAGKYTLTLDESLPDGAQIAIQAGAVDLRLVVPASAAVSVAVQRGPSAVQTEGEWTVTGSNYATAGPGPAWNIRLDAGVGSISLVAE